MTDATPAQLQRLIATTFDAQGWVYDLSVGPQIVEAIGKEGGVDSATLVRALPATFFERNRISRDLVSKVIERDLGGITLREEAGVAATIMIRGNNYQLNVGEGASIINSNVIVGEGTLIVATADADKQDVLLAVEAIVRAGLEGDWNEDAVKDLASVVNNRSDLDYEDVRKVASELAGTAQPTKARVRALLGRIATSGVGGALGTGITAGLGEAIAHLPF